jgi:septum formation protein
LRIIIKFLKEIPTSISIEPMTSLSALPLVLASTSPYRRELLTRLGLPFEARAPLCDEDVFQQRISDPMTLAQTLAFEKAKSLASEKHIVIGGDQLVALGSTILGKPKSFAKACEQLQLMSGKTHDLITAVCVFAQGKPHPLLNITRLTMRQLSRQQIENYVQSDQPLDAAGSYKIEKSGLTLFEKIECEDFSAIQGLPLIALTTLLSQWGFLIPGGSHGQ